MDHEISSPRELRPIKIRQQLPVYRLLRYPFLYLSLRSEIVIPVARPKSNTNFLIRRNKVKLDFRNFQVRKIIREDEKQERESRNRLDSSRKLGRSRRRKLELEKSWQDGLLLPHFGSRTIEREWRNWCGRNAASSSKTVESRIVRVCENASSRGWLTIAELIWSNEDRGNTWEGGSSVFVFPYQNSVWNMYKACPGYERRPNYNKRQSSRSGINQMRSFNQIEPP